MGSVYCKDCEYSDYVDGKLTCTKAGRCDEEKDEWDFCYDGNDSRYDENGDYISNCYLTTATCDILGLNRDNEYLNKLRAFRENVMRKDKKYFKLLALYDIVGPKVSKALHEDKNRQEIGNMIINKIKEAIDLLDSNQIDKAIDSYIKTTLGLAEYYGIEVTEITDETVNKMDVSKSGTGQYIKKKES